MINRKLHKAAVSGIYLTVRAKTGWAPQFACQSSRRKRRRINLLQVKVFRLAHLETVYSGLGLTH